MWQIMLCAALIVSFNISLPAAHHSHGEYQNHTHTTFKITTTVQDHSHSCCIQEAVPFAATLKRMHSTAALTPYSPSESYAFLNAEMNSSRPFYWGIILPFPANTSYLLGNPVMLV